MRSWEEIESKLNDSKGEGEEYPDPWKPQPGDVLLGTIKSIDLQAPTPHGKCDVATIETREGEERALWLSNKVLRQSWKELQPKVRDRIGVKYEGRRESRSGRKYKVFTLVVDQVGNNNQQELKPEKSKLKQALPF